jgi:integrase
LKGCRCKPAYYTFHRAGGTAVKGPRVHDRQTADRALRRLQVDIDEGRIGGASRLRSKTFDDWSAEYVDNLRLGGRRESTIRAYGPTVRYASAAFGASLLADVGNPQLRAFVSALREHRAGDATVAKHLRQLGAIFESASDDGLCPFNPVPKFKKSLRLRAPKGTDPLSDAELAKLWDKMLALDFEPVYVAICKTALTTGARQGELIAADWRDLDLERGELWIRRHYDRVSGNLTLPKDGETRLVYLTAPALKVLRDWHEWASLTGEPSPDAPMFPAPRGTRLNGQYLTRLVSKAMVKAAIPAMDAEGRRRKPFHALRSSYDRILREQGRNPEWVQLMMGHSSPELTLNHYGAWSEQAKRAQAEAVTEDAFPV